MSLRTSVAFWRWDIGMIEADQMQDGKTKTNARLLAVAVHSYSHENIKSIEEVQPH